MLPDPYQVSVDAQVADKRFLARQGSCNSAATPARGGAGGATGAGRLPARREGRKLRGIGGATLREQPRAAVRGDVPAQQHNALDPDGLPCRQHRRTAASLRLRRDRPGCPCQVSSIIWNRSKTESARTTTLNTVLPFASTMPRGRRQRLPCPAPNRPAACTLRRACPSRGHRGPGILMFWG